MATGAERQAAWRERREQELRALRAERGGGDSFARGVFATAQTKALPGVVLRADQTIGSTGTAGWAAEATRTSWRDYLVSLAPFNAGGRLIEQALSATLGPDNVLNYPAVAALPAVPGWVGEGAPIPAGAANFSTVTLGPPRKLGNILVWSRELALRSNATAIFAQLLRESVSARSTR